ncbi:MAG: D-glycero-beta-D-manno-heptose 1,7-bisphosphate 7-phosphatase [Pseudomonadales bacterium]|nr:D-glycero-beta-D-manno-heptose 1,7-bisphosphate 7-phosphatase [Pseudomonadales bacterium]
MSHAQLSPDLSLVLLDRDGVINADSKDYIKDPAEWLPIPGSLDAIAQLQLHVTVAVCTNQSGVDRGLFSLGDLRAIHEKFQSQLIAAGGSPLNIYFCPHGPDTGCECRKPHPGLLLTAMRELNANPSSTLFAGDSVRDLSAAEAAGCLPILLRTGNGNDALASLPATPVTFDDLSELAAAVTASKRRG